MIQIFSPGWLSQRRGVACLIAFASGATLVASFAPIDLYPFALICPAILAHLWTSASRARDAALIGFTFGMGLFMTGVSWVYVSLSVFGGMPAPIAGFATLLYCAFLSWPLALAGYVQHRLPGSTLLHRLCVIPAAWMFAEMLRGLGFTGFPWLVLGYSTTDTPLGGYAPIAGVYGLSLLMMICAGLILQLAAGPRRMMAAGFLAALIVGGAALRRVEWTQPYGSPITAALLQGNVAQDMKFDAERYAKTLDTYQRLAQAGKATLIVLPETALPRFLDQVDPAYLAGLESLAKQNGGDILVGVPYRTSQADFYNSVISLGVSRPQIYSKVHLVPFGEFVFPGFGWIVNILQIPMADFATGKTTQAPLEVAGQRVAMNICYEDVFGEEIIRPLPEATLLVNVSNMAWFGDSLAPGQHLQMARMRTMETGRAMLSATNTGMTAAIDRGGRVLGQLPQYIEARLEATVSGYAGATPFVHMGNWLAVALAIFLMALSAIRGKR